MMNFMDIFTTIIDNIETYLITLWCIFAQTFLSETVYSNSIKNITRSIFLYSFHYPSCINVFREFYPNKMEWLKKVKFMDALQKLTNYSLDQSETRDKFYESFATQRRTRMQQEISSSFFRPNCSRKPSSTLRYFLFSMKNFVPTLFLSVIFCSQAVSCLSNRTFLADGPLEFGDILPESARDYDKMAPPREVGHPTVVYFHVTVMSLDSIDESSMTYAADIFFAQSWKDWRLRLPDNMTNEYRLLPVHWLNDIWRPDSFFKNAKDVTFQEMTIPNHYIWLYKDKTILYMVKLTLVLSCAMNFEVYPHDSQECSMKIESLSHTTDDLVFVWDPEVPLVVDRIELPQLDLVKNVTGDCTQVYSTGNFTCLEVIFTFKRRLGYYLFHTYIPTCLIVIMSWISFWLRPEAVPARVTLGVTSLLTLTTQHANSQKSLPPVSYIKAIDVFMSSCMVFVFFSLMEYAVVNIVLGDITDEVTRREAGKGKYAKNLLHFGNVFKSQSSSDCLHKSLNNPEESTGGGSQTSRTRKSPSSSESQSGVTIESPATVKGGRINGRRAYVQSQTDPIERESCVATSPYFEASATIAGIQSATPLAVNIGLPPAPPPPISQDKQVSQIIKRRREKAIIIDRFSRILFPLSFTVLNVIYWSVFVIEWDFEWLTSRIYATA